MPSTMTNRSSSPWYIAIQPGRFFDSRSASSRVMSGTDTSAGALFDLNLSLGIGQLPLRCDYSASGSSGRGRVLSHQLDVGAPLAVAILLDQGAHVSLLVRRPTQGVLHFAYDRVQPSHQAFHRG